MVKDLRLGGRARALCIELYGEASSEWAFTTDLLAAAFRKHRELSSSDRRRASETVYGLVRSHRRQGAIISEWLGRGRTSVAIPSPTAALELHLIVFELRQGLPPEAVKADVKRLLGVDIDLTPVLAEDAGLHGTTGLDREATRLSYPTWLYQRFVNDLGEDTARALCESMNRRAPLTVHVNTARVTRDDLIARLADEQVVARPTELGPAGLTFATRVNAFALPAFRDGLFEVMDEGSQLCALAVAPPPGGRVVDACAGAGGKTLAIGADMAGKGRILALDTGGKKLEELRRRARRAGLNNVVAREVHGVVLPDEARLASWDRVLVDAPCSGLGTLRRNPEARWRLTEKVVDSFPARQLALLVTYAPLCAVGGRLIYATCTVLADENQRVVGRFLAERPDFEQVPLKEIWGRERATRMGDGVTLQLYPHVHDTDGFFAAILRRVR